MSLPRSTGSRTERPDTKTLVTLGHGEAAADGAASGTRGRDVRSRVATRPLATRAPAEAADTTAGRDTAVGTDTAAGTDTDRKAVQLWFKGVREPVRARAEIGDSVLQLTAPLPFLELDSVVGFKTGEGEALLHGRIRRVQLEAGAAHSVPQLSIELGLIDAASATEAHANDERADEVRPDRASVRPTEPAQDAREILPAPRSRVLPWLSALVIGAAAGAGATYVWLPARAPHDAPAAADATREGAPPNAAAATRSSGARGAAPLLGASIVEALAAERTAALEQVRAAEEARRAALWRPLAAYDVQPPLAPEAAHARDAAGAVDEVIAPESQPASAGQIEDQAKPSRAGEQASAETPARPRVSVRGAQTHVFIPMQGDGVGVRQYELTTPGVAVSVPHARALIPLENYAIGRGIVRRVWVRQQGAGVQVRVITKRPAVRSIVSFDETGLRIVLSQ